MATADPSAAVLRPADDRDLATELSILVAELGVVEVFLTGLLLKLIDVGREILGDEPVEEHAEHVALEVPAVDAAPQVVGDPPDGLVQLCSLGFFGPQTHGASVSGEADRSWSNVPWTASQPCQ